ncbi:MAG: hypothetical protein ABJZ55_02770 [Fuerstiella sp.]
MSTDNRRAFESLHLLLQKLTNANQLLEHGPKRVANCEQKVVAAQEVCDHQKAEIQQIKKKADQTALHLKTSEGEVDKQKLRLNDAKSNKEYEIIGGQIEAAKQKCEAFEDQILDLLNQVDEAETKLEDLKGLKQEADDKVESVKATVAKKRPGLLEEVESLNSRIAEAEKLIPTGEATSNYKRLKDSLKDKALAKVEDGYCEQCNSQLTSQDAVQVNMGKYMLCRQCGRILYRPVDDA